MKRILTLVVAFAAGAAVCSISLGAEANKSSAWSWSNLNPVTWFSSSKTTKASTARAKPAKRNYAPVVTPKQQAAKPSLYKQVTDGTKSFFRKTNETLNPWAKPAKPAERSATGLHTATRPSRQPAKRSLWPSFFGTKEAEPMYPKAPHDFLGQPRVR